MSLAALRAARRARTAEAPQPEPQRCDLCRRPVTEATIAGTGERRLLDVEPIDIVAWHDLQRAGADTGLEPGELRGYTADGRTIVGVAVSAQALAGVPRTKAHTNHRQTCPRRDPESRPWLLGG